MDIKSEAATDRNFIVMEEPLIEKGLSVGTPKSSTWLWVSLSCRGIYFQYSSPAMTKMIGDDQTTIMSDRRRPREKGYPKI